MKKIHTYEIQYYSGQWLKRKFIEASTKSDALRKVRETDKVTEIYSVRFIR